MDVTRTREQAGRRFPNPNLEPWGSHISTTRPTVPVTYRQAPVPLHRDPSRDDINFPQIHTQVPHTCLRAMSVRTDLQTLTTWAWTPGIFAAAGAAGS